MRYFGLTTGTIFFLLSVLLTVSIVGPLYLIIFTEGLGGLIDGLFTINHVSATTFYLSVVVVVATFLTYLGVFLKTRRKPNGLFILLCLVLLFFLNSALFYYDFIQPGFRADAQQAMNIIDKPLQTSLVYLLLGLLHDNLLKKRVAEHSAA